MDKNVYRKWANQHKASADKWLVSAKARKKAGLKKLALSAMKHYHENMADYRAWTELGK